MKSLSFAIVAASSLLAYASPNPDVTLFNIIDPTEAADADALPTTYTDGTLDNIGAANGETTYVLEETDTEGGVTEAFTGTLVASANGYRITEIPGAGGSSAQCTKNGDGTGSCVFEGPLEEGGSESITFTQSGSVVIQVFPEATSSGAASSSEPSALGSASNTGSAATPSNSSGNDNGAATIAVGFVPWAVAFASMVIAAFLP